MIFTFTKYLPLQIQIQIFTYTNITLIYNKQTTLEDNTTRQGMSFTFTSNKPTE